MPTIRYYAPNGVNNITLPNGAKLNVVNGYVTADSNFAMEMLNSGFVPGVEDMVIAKRDALGNLVGVMDSQTGVELLVGGSSKFVSGDVTVASCASGVSTPFPMVAANLLDSHGLVDTVNGWLIVPSDATHMSTGLRVQPTWPNALGTYREASFEIEIVASVWVAMGARSDRAFTTGPMPGPMMEMYPCAAWRGKKMRFAAKQDSGGALTPTNFSFYAQFLTMP